MTSIPSTPPVPFAQPRPASAPQGLSVPAPISGAAIDPIKLLNRHKWILVGAAVAGGLAGVGANYALESIYPLWRPFALFQCNAPVENVGQTGVASNPEEMNRFMQTQIRFMTTESILGAVVDDPALQRNAPEWSKRYMRKDPASQKLAFDGPRALRALSDDVSARVYPNTSLIELSFSDHHKEDAYAIVGLVRQKYMAELARQGTVAQDERTSSLREAINRIEQEVTNLQTRRQTLIQNEKLESIDERAGATLALVNGLNVELTRVRQDLTAATSQLNSMSGDLNNPAGYVYGDEIKQASERDPMILDLKTTIARMESELQAMKNKGITPEHREYKTLDARITGAKQNYQSSLNDTQQKLFYSQIDTLSKSVKSLQQQETRLVQELQDGKARMVALNKLQNDLADIERQIENLLKTRAENNAELEKVKVLSRLASFNRVMTYQPERMPTELYFPRMKFMIPLGIILGIGLVGGLVVLREIADQRVKGPSDIALIPRMRLLGWIPDAADDPEGKGAPETAFRDRPRGVVAEGYRQLRSAVLKRTQHAGHKTILVMSGMPGAGATSLVANLALAMAAADKKVLVIDANLRRPSLHRVFGAQESPGLADVLMAHKTFDAAIQQTATPNVDLLSAGSNELRVVERLAAEAKGDVLAAAKAKYDVVLIDVAPAVVAGDSVALAHRVDATVLVVRAMADKRGMIARIRNEIADARSEFLGVVVNGVRASAGGYMRRNIRTAAEYAKT